MLDVDMRAPRRDFEVAVAFTVADGERLALFGPSGAGKTTVLEAIAGLVPAYGRIALDGRELGRSRHGRISCGAPVWERQVTLLRQDPVLFPHLSVGQNLSYGQARRDTAEVDRLVRVLQLEGLSDIPPRRISGGQAQRVSLGRALLARRRALLLDEPYSGLDAPLRRELTELVRAEAARHQVPAVLVAHELDEAQAFCDRLGVLDRGRLLQLGAPDEVVRSPASRRVAELVGYRGFVSLGASDGRPGRGTVTAAVHPERALLGAHPGRGPVLKGHVRAIRASGVRWDVDAVVLGSELSFRADGPAPTPGAEIEITLVDPPMFGPDGRPAGHFGGSASGSASGSAGALPGREPGP